MQGMVEIEVKKKVVVKGSHEELSRFVQGSRLVFRGWDELDLGPVRG